MQKEKLQISQYVLKHPVMREKETYKKNYINVLEYFVKKYAGQDAYALGMLELYKKKLLDHPKEYAYQDEEIRNMIKSVTARKMKKFLFFSYRYCLVTDILFMCAFDDQEQSERICQEMLEIYGKKHGKKLMQLCFAIKNGEVIRNKRDQTDYMLECVKKNREFLQKKRKNILVTANMSAGKSTLLNALIGKKVNRTQSEACTAKTHYLFNKAFEDSLSGKLDFDLDLDAAYDVLMKDHSSNTGTEISIGTKFRSPGAADMPVCFIDTPGVNFSMDRVHRKISRADIVNMNYDLMVYVLNGKNLGTADDRRHLDFVFENYKGEIVFVVNKLDHFKAKEDSVSDTIRQVREDLEQTGYQNPVICPVSAYAAYLARQDMQGEELNEDEREELERLHRKLNKEEYQFHRYYQEKYSITETGDDRNQQLLLHSGILSLEKILYEER